MFIKSNKKEINLDDFKCRETTKKEYIYRLFDVCGFNSTQLSNCWPLLQFSPQNEVEKATTTTKTLTKTK